MKLKKGNFIDDLYRWHKAYINNIKALSYSINTISLYDRAINAFIEYSLEYQDDMELTDVKSLYITNYLSYIEDEAEKRGLASKKGSYISKSTKQTYLKAIKGFFTFISDNNDELVTFERYFKNIKVADSSKMEEKLIYLSEAEVDRLLKYLEKTKLKDSYNSHRNSLLIKLMLFAGLRVSEALHVTLDNFTVGEGELLNIEIYGKGGKYQIAYISHSIIDDELSYFRDAVKLDSNKLIMVTKNDKQLDRSNAFTIVNNIYKHSSIQKKGLHLLRHTLAMKLTKQGVNPIVIKKILRHSNIATTTIYAKATEESVVEALNDSR